MLKKYSDVLVEWLVELGYTHCFFVAGGNIMHLLESCSRQLTCIPVVHEVAAGIASEYFNEVHLGGKAFALVTAGPGLTNIVTAMAGAYLESRELLIIGGQVKVADLARGEVRQRGIQEINGVAITISITQKSLLMDTIVDRQIFAEQIRCTASARKGPVFVEIPLDVQGAKVDSAALNTSILPGIRSFNAVDPEIVAEITMRLRTAQRPVILLGAGVDRSTAESIQEQLIHIGVPVQTTWNASDRIAADHPLYFGRPNTWGQRYANILIQQADIVLALGTRLSLQQTGFNWQKFVPHGDILQVDCDSAELVKGHPHVSLAVCGDANEVLRAIVCESLGVYDQWISFCRMVREALPLVESINHTGESYLSPYDFVERLSILASAEDIVVPCSSGSAFTVMMQTFAQKAGQRMVTNKALASMGYGLSGAIGAAFAGNGRRTILVEGDGGFLQNMQELGTVAVNHLNLKIFIFDDNGYASIRMTQSNYFGGRYVGCDSETGLGIPEWRHLFAAYNIPMQRTNMGFDTDAAFLAAFNAPGPSAFLVHIDPKQTYFPKISSRITDSGSMESNPLHLMTPDLDEATATQVFKYL